MSGNKCFDAAKAQELQNSIREGELLLEANRTPSGKKMTQAYREMTLRAVNNSRAKLKNLA